MSHNEVVKRFKQYFNIDEHNIECWFPNGKGSVRIRLIGHGDLIFTLYSKRNWRLETVDSWLDSVKVNVQK